MEEALDEMESARDRGVVPLTADRLFHLRLAEATGNSALAMVVKTLWDQRTGPLFLRLEHHFDTPALWTVAIKEHREIVAAVARHDAAGARAAMRRHMNHAAKRFSASWDQGKKAR
jgi:DNA-binding FadR family transcriptional regulator